MLAVVPARGGSRGIAKKNLALLAGKPLVQHTLEAALASKELARVVLSTDDPVIAEVGRRTGVEVPFRRPRRLATATATAASVVRHALEWLRAREGWEPAAVVLLQPTSPLRGAHHIDDAIRAFRQSRADSLVSVCPVREHPWEMVTVQDGIVRRLLRRRPVAGRQRYPRVYWVNGAIYITRPAVVLEQGTLYGRRVRPFVMDPEVSVDVDTPFDLQLAECLVARS